MDRAFIRQIDKYMDVMVNGTSDEILSEYKRQVDQYGGGFDQDKWRESKAYKTHFTSAEEKELPERKQREAEEADRFRAEKIAQFKETGQVPPDPEDEVPQPEDQQDTPQPNGDESEDESGAAAAVPAKEREYLDPGENPPEGIPVLTGKNRKGKMAKFYDKRQARQKKKGGQAQQPVPGQQQIAPNPNTQIDPIQMADDNEMSGDNKMAKPVDDYKEMIEQAVDKAKQQQSKSKVRSAKAQARVAKAHANEAEANAEAAEQKAEEKIASILHKLDSNISELSARKNPEIDSVLSKLDSTIRFAKSNNKKN